MGNNDNFTLQKVMDKTQIKQRFYNLPNSAYLLYNGQTPRPVTIVQYSADRDFTNKLSIYLIGLSFRPFCGFLMY